MIMIRQLTLVPDNLVVLYVYSAIKIDSGYPGSILPVPTANSHFQNNLYLNQVIRNHPNSLEIYQRKLLESGNISKEDIDKLNKKVNTILNEEFQNSKDHVPNKRDWLSAYWTGFKSPEQISRIRNTG
jgi:hypothetical protein